jgi:hypothetical protein
MIVLSFYATLNMSLALGDPFILTDEQIAETARGFASYGLQDAPRAKIAPTRTGRTKAC